MEPHHIDAIRHFNRFYTRYIGVLDAGFLDSPFSLTEARVLYEIAHNDGITASDLTRGLGIDPGYLSRMLVAFAHNGLVLRRVSKLDARRAELSLTAKGRRQFASLDKRQQEKVREMLQHVPKKDHWTIVDYAQSIERMLTRPKRAELPPKLRSQLRPGDIGWIIHRQAVLYHDEYRWDNTYEALIAGIMASFVKQFDPKKERCWIAERGKDIVGSVFCVRKSTHVAQLRLLYVEPSERGSGLGTQLVNECIAFARRTGYRKLMLWTNSILHSARHIYERVGFRLVTEEQHRSFGRTLTGQIWEMNL